MHAILLWLMQDLRQINPEIKNSRQIRGSVIVHWLRQYNIRQVQYMAGHKHISSTEKYRHHETETLQEALFKHHPSG